jgi:hypothetical protein
MTGVSPLLVVLFTAGFIVGTSPTTGLLGCSAFSVDYAPYFASVTPFNSLNIRYILVRKSLLLFAAKVIDLVSVYSNVSLGRIFKSTFSVKTLWDPRSDLAFSFGL